MLGRTVFGTMSLFSNRAEYYTVSKKELARIRVSLSTPSLAFVSLTVAGLPGVAVAVVAPLVLLAGAATAGAAPPTTPVLAAAVTAITRRASLDGDCSQQNEDKDDCEKLHSVT